jgi:L-fuculose-phosphate aldolase
MNPAEKQQVSKEIVESCHRLWQRGLVANHDGNISFKLDSNLFLATPTSFSKLDVTEGDLLLIDAQGKVLEGRHKVFSEISWHMAIYKTRPDIKCIVHGHPVTAGGFALSGNEIGTPAIPEAIVSLGRAIKTTKFFSPLEISLTSNNQNFENELERVLEDCDGFLVPGNGAWSVGSGVMQTYLRLELIEQVAKQHMHAQNLGSIKPLPKSLVDELMKKRPKPSVSTSPPSAVPTSPILSGRILELVEAELSKILNLNK